MFGLSIIVRDNGSFEALVVFSILRNVDVQRPTDTGNRAAAFRRSHRRKQKQQDASPEYSPSNFGRTNPNSLVRLSHGHKSVRGGGSGSST